MTILSMTGFGDARITAGERSWAVTLRSVNHRSINVRARLPSELAAMEAALTRQVSKRLGRGAVDLTIAAQGEAPVDIRVDFARAAAVATALEELALELGTDRPTIELIVKTGDVLRTVPRDLDADEVGEAITAGVADALDKLIEMRRAEGALLAADLDARLQSVAALLEQVQQKAPTVLAAFEERLRTKAAALQSQLGIAADDSRLAAELIVWSDRSDVTEELVRARTHIARFRQIVTDGDADGSGKRLEFLSQELLRELNTVGSKCRDAPMAGWVVDAKVELEKIREQVCNIA